MKRDGGRDQRTGHDPRGGNLSLISYPPRSSPQPVCGELRASAGFAVFSHCPPGLRSLRTLPKVPPSA